MKISAGLRKGLVGLSLVLLGTFAQPAWAIAPWEAGKRYALIVGIDDYIEPTVTDLKCATSDAKLLKSTLVKEGGFSEENIFLLSSAATGENDQPSLTNIVFRLEWLREVVGPSDTLVFYFAGHGVSMESETFLLTAEADQRDKNTLMVSSLRGKVLNEMLKQTGAQNTLVLLDACRNDPTAGRGDVNNTLNETLTRGLVFKPQPAAAPGLERNTATVFACSEGERSWEWGDKNQGFFTYYLAEALSSGAYDADGKATLQNLVGYLREKVNATALRETNHKQTPMLTYEGPGPDKWVLAKSAVAMGAQPKLELGDIKQAQLAAEVQAKDLKLRQEQDRVTALEAEALLAKAANKALEAENELLKAKAEGRNEAKATENLEFAKDMLTLAQGEKAASTKFVASTASLQKETAMRLETTQVAAEVMHFGAQNPDSPDLASLQARLSKLEADLVQLDKERKEAVERAVAAEHEVAVLQKVLKEKWAGRSFGPRPTKRKRFGDLIKIVTSDDELQEALEEDLPD
jgi:uncharacterized caspase-like protein